MTRGYGGRGDFGGGRGRAPRGDERQTEGEVTAPYGFVPLGPVVEPSWLRDAVKHPFLHDIPFRDGVSGTFDLVIENETPICVSGPDGDRNEGRERAHFRFPDGTYAIPGSSLRGALRNVVEIASFSRMQHVNDHRYAVRDLQNRELYGNHMADIVHSLKSGKKEPMPLVNAGWLTLRGEDERNAEHYATIEPCHFAKIEYGHITRYAESEGNTKFNPNRKQSAVDKYAAWGDTSRGVRLPVVKLRQNDARTPSDYGVVAGGGAPVDGTLVFTGQPQNHDPERKSKGKGAGNAKHHDFVFHGKAGSPIAVTKKVYDDFCFGHADRGQQNRMSDAPNKEWGYWKPKVEGGERMPVFFLLEPLPGSRDVRLRAFGLAMMFRLAYKLSIHDALKNANHDPRSSGLDLAEGLFGTVRKPEGGDTLTLRGRVQLGHAVAEGRPAEVPPKTMILSAPKASYYPNYVTQGGVNGRAARDRSGKPSYQSWMDKDATPRGWKRYHTQTELAKPFIPSKADVNKVGTVVKALAPGATFRASINVHNLRPEELGALLWAIDFGGDEAARHGLGLARPMGYGRARMRVENFAIKRLDGDEAVEAEAIVKRFAAYMEEQLPGWSRSHQIQELLAIARPKAPDQVRYQRLEPRNEFIEAKKQGWSLKSWASGVDVQRAHPRETPHTAAGHDYEAARMKAASASTTPRRAPWPGMRGGQQLTVELTGLSKKGKWKGQAVEFQAQGTIAGTPPPDAAAGLLCVVIIAAGGDPSNLVLKWPE